MTSLNLETIIMAAKGGRQFDVSEMH